MHRDMEGSMTQVLPEPSPELPHGIHLVAGCSGGTCPAIYEDSRGNYLVQGIAVAATSVRVTLPDGEALVSIPRGLVAELVKAVRS